MPAKSTAIGLLLVLLAPGQGEVPLFGQAPGALAARRRSGVMLQSAGIPDNIRVAELLDLTRSYYPTPRSVADCVTLAGLEGLLDRPCRRAAATHSSLRSYLLEAKYECLRLLRTPSFALPSLLFPPLFYVRGAAE